MTWISNILKQTLPIPAQRDAHTGYQIKETEELVMTRSEKEEIEYEGKKVCGNSAYWSVTGHHRRSYLALIL